MTIWDHISTDPVHYAVRVLLWALAFLVLLIVLSLWGCAQVPPCEKFKLSQYENMKGETFYVLDLDNAVKLVQMVEALNNGTCKVE